MNKRNLLIGIIAFLALAWVLCVLGITCGQQDDLYEFESSSLPRNETGTTQDEPITIPDEPIIHLSMYDTEDPCEVGDNTIYVLEVRNEGLDDVTELEVNFTIPDETSFYEAEALTEHIEDGSQIEFQPYPKLQIGDKLTYRIAVTCEEAGSATAMATVTYLETIEELVEEEGTSIYE